MLISGCCKFSESFVSPPEMITGKHKFLTCTELIYSLVASLKVSSGFKRQLNKTGSPQSTECIEIQESNYVILAIKGSCIVEKNKKK